MSTNRHLVKAKDYIGKGETFYRRAAQEIQAAVTEGLTQAEVARQLGRTRSWVTELLQWHGHDHDHAPFGGPGQDAAQSKSRAKKFLSQSEPEQIKAVLADLSDDQLSVVAGHARQIEYERYEAEVQEPESDAQRKAREARKAKGKKRLDIFVILTSLKTATTDLRSTLALIREAELNEDEIGKVQHFVGRTRGALELIETALETEGASDWDAALAELVVES